MDKYYEAPSDEIFEEIKKEAIKIWKTYDDTYGYASGKIDRIKDIGNIQDNAMSIISMFDSSNIAKLLVNLSPDARTHITERIT